MPWDDDDSEEDFLYQKVESTLSDHYGRNIGLNADWSVSAWALGKNRYITDNENDTYSIVVREWDDNNDDLWDEITEEYSWNMNSESDLRKMLRDLKRKGY